MTAPNLQSELGVPHGFFGRRGGVSGGIYASLNAGRGSEDEPGHIVENLDRVRAALGAEAMVTNRQVHSGLAHYIDHPHHDHAADGLVTDRPGLAIGALGADCAPVLFSAENTPLIGACHAGWRGAVGGIVEATVALMRARGATTIRAAIGPCISQSRYEVGEDFRKAVLRVDADAGAYFADIEPSADYSSDKSHFDLPGYVALRLERAGVSASLSAHRCTYLHPDEYFSFRRATHRGEPDYGRNLSAICLPPE